MNEVVWKAALDGLARGLGDFWPGEIAISTDAALLERAERYARGNQSGLSGKAPDALASIFCNLRLSGEQSLVQPAYLPLRPLELTAEALMPRTGVAAAARSLAELREGFQKAPRAMRGFGLNAQIERALDAAMRFAWCVPANGYDEQTDISRYNHARSVAAIVGCMAAAREATQDVEQFALLGADLSGIQTFIYTLASDGAAKSLRARSFYLQLLTEAMAHYVLRELDLPITNLLYAGGGGFQILAPAGAAITVKDIEAELQRRLLIAHRAALNITLRATTFSGNAFANYSQVRDDLGNQLNRAKRRPFAFVPSDELAKYIGQPEGSGGEDNFCRVTGEEVSKSKAASAEDNLVKSDFVESLEKLGRLLPEARFLTLKAATPSNAERVRDWQGALRMFGLSAQLQVAVELDRIGSDVTVMRFDPVSPVTVSASSYYPLAQLIPRGDDGTPKLFDALAEASAGLRRWAVLRMDVDNLGRLFRNGFGDNASLARTNSLSFALRLFFEGWLPKLAEQHPNLKDKLYIQYSGGDDVFVVGAWDAVAEYALRIRRSFSEYTAHNPAITLSAGIALADVKFPLYQAARMAGEAEEHAKAFTRPDGKRKVAVTFLGETLGWNEYERVYHRAMELKQWCAEDDVVSRALLRTLQQLHTQTQDERSRRKRDEPKRKYTRATWLAAYQMTRVMEGLKTRNATDEETIKREIATMQAELMQADASTNALALAARWAQFLIR